MKQRKPKFTSVNSKGELKELQRTFADIIRRPLTDADEMQRDARSDSLIASSKKLTPHDRLELYAQQYWWRIEDAFDEDFTTMRAAVPAAVYLKVRDAYLRQVPSTSYTLRNLGSKLPQFIKKKRSLSAPYTDLMWDYARFDWARVEAFDLAHNPSLTASDLQNATFPKKKLKLQPHIQLLSLSFAVDKGFSQGSQRYAEQASNTELSRKSKAGNRKTQAVKKEAVMLAVHRHDERIFIKRVSKEEFLILQKLQTGTSLLTLMQTLARSKSFKPSTLQTAFREWTTLGWIYVGKKTK